MTDETPVRQDFLPFSRPTLEDDEIAEVVDSLRSGWITTGPKTARFEALFRERLEVPEAVAVSSGTAGLHLVLHALGVGPGDEVIVPAITWASSANVVELLGARAVLADVDSRTLQLDPLEVERLLSERTRAVVVVHFAGAPADLDALRDVLRGTNVFLLEDAAHALGTAYRGREIGSDSFAAVFSFHPIKAITTGEGGMVVCQDSQLAARIRQLSFHGLTREAWSRYRRRSVGPRYEIVEPGYKYNMLDLQAALGLRQLPKLARFIASRRAQAGRYDERLIGLPGLQPIGRVPYASMHAWHLYVVRAAGGVIRRDDLLAALAAENIGTGVHFYALHLQPYYRERYGYGPDDLPRAAAAGEEVLSLPLFPGLTEDEQDDVIRALRKVLTPSDARTAAAPDPKPGGG